MSKDTVQKDSTKKQAVIFGDIGGSNIRIAACVERNICMEHKVSYSTSRFATLEEMVQEYCNSYGLEPVGGAFAVAGPTDGVVARLTNAEWTADVRTLSFPCVLLNDLQAAGCALPSLASMEPKIIQAGQAERTQALSVVLGVGTGLGMALVTADDVFSTEFGHTSFAPVDKMTGKLHKWMLENHRRVRNEDVLSGRAMPSLIQFCVHDLDIDLEDVESKDGAWVSENPEHPVASEVLSLFFTLLGAVCGDIILSTRPKQLVLCGGVVSKLFTHWHSRSSYNIGYLSLFFMALYNKAPMEKIVKASDIVLVQSDDIALLGAKHRALAMQ